LGPVRVAPVNHRKSGDESVHELSIVQSLLEKALEVAEEHGRLPVEKVRVRIGRLRQVVPDVLVYSFDIAKKGTLAENAVLDLEQAAPLVCCARCFHEFEPTDVYWLCPKCGSVGGKVLKGEELILETVSLKDD
jgi:hydrogenase nickel incorporation protein HypA/HybF